MDDERMERTPLIEYLPPFMRQFAEIKEIMKTSQVEVDMVDSFIQRTLANSFILDCDEWGIKKFENILKITPSAEDTLDSRKSRVLIRWNDKVPYTIRVLINKLNALCGVNGYNTVSDLENYHIEFHTSLSLFGQVKELEMMLEKILPENIYFISDNELLCESKGYSLISGGICTVGRFTLTNDFKGKVETADNFYYSGGVVQQSRTHTTNDFKENYESEGDALVASGTVSVGFYEI